VERVPFAGGVGTAVEQLLERLDASTVVDLRVEAVSTRLLSLPFEAAVLRGGRVAVSHPAMRLSRGTAQAVTVWSRGPGTTQRRGSDGDHDGFPGADPVLVPTWTCVPHLHLCQPMFWTCALAQVVPVPGDNASASIRRLCPVVPTTTTVPSPAHLHPCQPMFWTWASA
jgi:hypothetical protein